MAPEDPGDVTENRRATRHIALVPLRGFFGSAEVEIQDLSEGGFQIEHSDTVKLGSSATLSFDNPKTFETIVFRARVVWSRLSPTPSARGKLLYRSGLRIELAEEPNRSMLKKLIAQVTRPDTESLERKRQKRRELAREREKPPLKVIHNSALPPEQVLIIQQARKHLRANPIESLRWHNRAKFSLTDEQIRAIQEMQIHHRDDVLAVWEYLERRYPIAVVARALDDHLRR